MMTRDDIAELFSSFGAVDVRSMFGGVGIYAEGVMFALRHDGVLYLKADLFSRAAFEHEGEAAFSYTTKNGKRAVMSYWRVPARLYDDPDELARWARTALDVAQRSSAGKSREAPTGARR
jgi:DNA transformation protein and related proteins